MPLDFNDDSELGFGGDTAAFFREPFPPEAAMAAARGLDGRPDDDGDDAFFSDGGATFLSEAIPPEDEIIAAIGFAGRGLLIFAVLSLASSCLAGVVEFAGAGTSPARTDFWIWAGTSSMFILCATAPSGIFILIIFLY